MSARADIKQQPELLSTPAKDKEDFCKIEILAPLSLRTKARGGERPIIVAQVGAKRIKLKLKPKEADVGGGALARRRHGLKGLKSNSAKDELIYCTVIRMLPFQ
jgi:hypothetical protein